MADALPPPPPAAAIVVTGNALPEAKAERAYGVERIGQREIAQSPTHELDQLLKDVPGVQLFRRSDARSGHPTSQGVTLRALGGNASSRALLVLDGVPQSDPFGGWVNWPAYDPSTCGRSGSCAAAEASRMARARWPERSRWSAGRTRACRAKRTSAAGIRSKRAHVSA